MIQQDADRPVRPGEGTVDWELQTIRTRRACRGQLVNLLSGQMGKLRTRAER